MFSFLPLSDADFRQIFGWNIFLSRNVEFFKFFNFWNKNILAYFCPKKLIPGAKNSLVLATFYLDELAYNLLFAEN